MLTHPTVLFSGDYNSALRGRWPLKFLHNLQLPKMYFKSDMGHRAASCWALPHISSLDLIRTLRSCDVRVYVSCTSGRFELSSS